MLKQVKRNNHLRKTFYILLICSLILLSCKQNKGLKGTWISAYEFNSKDTLTNLDGIRFNQVITFEKDYYTLKEFKFIWYEEIARNKYEFKNGRLKTYRNSSDYDNYWSVGNLIDPLTKDSLVLIDEIGLIKKRVYKKLNDSLKNKSNQIQLTGKSFIREFNKQIDTLTFVNDSVFINTTFLAKQTKNTDLNWERTSHFGFDIIFMEYTLPYIIKNKKGNTIYLSAFDKIKINFTLTEIE